MRKSYKQVRETLSNLAEASSKSDPDMKRFIGAEARLYIIKATESTAERIGYTEFYRNELERLEVVGRKR